MDRKKFLISIGYTFLCAPVLNTILQGCSTAHLTQNTLTEDQIITIDRQVIVNNSAFAILKKGKTSYRKYVIIKHNKLQFPICLFRTTDGEYSALLMRCTHRGCELKPEGAYLVCPCHGSEFTNKGMVINPPADQNLETFKTTTDNEKIYIHI